MYRIGLENLFEKWPSEGDIWGDCPMRDIPPTMEAAIRNADSRIKAISVSCVELPENVAVQLRDVAKEKGIHIVWVSPWHVRLNPPDSWCSDRS